MKKYPTFVSSTAAATFLENATYGDHLFIRNDLFQVTTWNHNYLILTRNGDGKEYRYNSKRPYPRA